MTDLPALVVAASVSCYWVLVLGLAVRRRFSGRSASVVPHLAAERWLFVGFVPTIALWLVLPILSLRSRGAVSPLLAVPEGAGEGAILGLRISAAGLVAGAVAFSVPCWRAMGSAWSMAVVPGAGSTLVTSGPWRRVRHPIYTLGILAAFFSAIAVPTLSMGLVAVVYGLLLSRKAALEEEALVALHGEAYLSYRKTTGRFFPRVRPG